MLNKFFYMASRATYQNILSGGDIFSSKSKMYYRHRKYILYKFMYNLFFGIAYGHLGSIHTKNEIFSKNKQKRENKNNHKVFLMFIISDIYN